MGRTGDMLTIDNQPGHALIIAYGPTVWFAFEYTEIVSLVDGVSGGTIELGRGHNINNRVCSFPQRVGERLPRRAVLFASPTILSMVCSELLVHFYRFDCRSPENLPVARDM